jgi:non-ribosomal peptide synthetase component E (peptide arylation enzyme)
MVGAYERYAAKIPNHVACRTGDVQHSWIEVKTRSDNLAANLVKLGLRRGERVLTQIATGCDEFVLRIALKKAGLVGVYVALQWRASELRSAMERCEPAAIVMPLGFKGTDFLSVWRDVEPQSACIRYRISSGDSGASGWTTFADLQRPASASEILTATRRTFSFDEVSAITTSSGTSGVPKLIEWPEAAQCLAGRGIAARLGLSEKDNVGMFSPMTGGAGALLWAASATVPCEYTLPSSYEPDELVDLAERTRVSVISTVPVILARLSQLDDLECRDLRALRAVRIGTAPISLDVGKTFEARIGCKVVAAAGSMEVPGFGHLNVNDPQSLRFSGTVGLPLPGCYLRIEDEEGSELPHGEVGELKAWAAFGSSGYWRDPVATARAWGTNSGVGWYASGDMAFVDESGRLTLVGRRNEMINRSGHKIPPLEVERVIARHPGVLECAVIGMPDAEYGEVPVAYVLPRPGAELDDSSLAALIRSEGLATYKIPVRFSFVADFPRIGENKVDKKRLAVLNAGKD